MKKSLKYLFIIVVLNFLYINIYALDMMGYGSYGTPSSTSGYGTGSGGMSTMPIAYGYRVTIVDSTGKRKEGTHTHDFWSNQYSSGSWGGVWGYTGFKNALSSSGNGSNSILWSYGFGGDSYKTIKLKYFYPKNYASEVITSSNKDYVARNGKTLASNIDLFNESSVETIVGGANYYGATPGGGSSGSGALKNNAGIAVQLQIKLFQIINNLKNNSDTLTDEEIDNMIQPFVTLINECSNSGNSLDIRNLDGYYLVIEPLIAINRSDWTYYIVVGTAKELYKMGFYSGAAIGWQYDYYSYHNPLVYYDGNSSVVGINSCSSLTSPMSFSNVTTVLGDKGCGGVFVVDISEMGITQKDEECKETASTKLASAHSIEKKKDYYETLTGYDKSTNKYSIIEDSVYAKYSAKCFPSGVNPDDENYGLNMNECYQLSYDYVKNVGYNSASEDLCAKPTCGEALKTVELNFARPNPPSTTTTATTAYDKAVEYLYENYRDKFADNPSSTDLLKYSNYSALRKNPDCGVSIPTCHTKASISCENVDVYSVFKISDSTECNVFTGVAYSSNGSIQSNLDRNYNSNIYCRESVSFVFPGKPKVTKAGRLLSWGVTTNTDGDYVRKIGETNEFGKMIITRTCQLDDYNKDKDRPKDTQIYTTWANDLHPKITLTYDDKVSKKTGNLEAKLVKFNAGKETIAKEIFDDKCTKVSTEIGAELVSGDRALNECIKNYTCKNDNCSDAYVAPDKSFTSVATFDIVYADNLKWYADKTDQYNPKIEDDTSKSESGEIDNQYILMGYGMPTDLFSGSCNYNKIGINASGEEDRSAGELSVSIENIGSKTDVINPDKYHFDGLLHMNLIYDENGKLVNGITDDKNKIFTTKDKENGDTPKTNIESNRTLYYNCPFKIQNNIFGYEDGKIGDSIICNDEAKGLDVVFRTVRLMDNASDTELFKAFPGRVGDGRYIGSNWRGKSYKVLYSILTSDIYEKEEPLYHIELTPSKIKAIRENNYKMKNSYNVDPYTNMDSIKTENGLEEPTYIFSIINDWENIKKVYDFDGDGRVDATDASSMLYCSNKEKHIDDPDFENYCSKYNGADATGALAAFAAASSGKINDGIGIHSTSYYLDTLKDNYGLDGICMQYSATERAEKYSNTNGCNYPGRLTVYSGLDPHDLNGDGSVDSSDAAMAMQQGDYELGQTILNEAAKKGAGDIQFTSDLNS